MNRRCFRGIGFTLIEIVVAVSLFVVGLIGVFAVLPTVLKSSKRTAVSTQVALYSRKILTEVKLKDYSWLKEYCSSPSGCPLDGGKGDFSWNVTVEDSPLGKGLSRVRILIGWQEDEKEKQEEFYTYIGNLSF